MKKLSDNLSRTVLDNGLIVLVKENHASEAVAIFTYVKAGYFNEPDNMVGISHLLEHMYFKGTRKRKAGQIATETKELGGYLNASTIYDHTLYYTVLPSSNFAQGLDIQSDALMNSVFDEQELEKEIEVVIQEAKRKLDTPAAFAREKLFELAFTKHRLRRWRIGTEEGLRSLTRDDFLSFHKNLYRPENMILVVVGDVDTADALKKINHYYAPFERGYLIKENTVKEPVQTEFRHRQLQGDIRQCNLSVAFHTPPFFHADTFALEILSFILGHGRSSRMFQRLREETRLVESISVYDYVLQDLGLFLVEAVVKPENLREAQIAIMREIAASQREKVIQGELEKARNMVESMYVFSMETVSGQANMLASYEAFGGYELIEDYIAKFYQVAPDDIQAVAQKYLTPTNCSLLEYVPHGTEIPRFQQSTLEQEFENIHPIDTRQSEIARKRPENIIMSNLANLRDKEVCRRVLANGATLIVKENHQLPIVSTGIFSLGSRSLEHFLNFGISGLVARTAIKGTQKRTASQIAKQIENLGTTINLSNDPDYLSAQMDILSKNFRAGWDILTDVLSAPTFPESEITKEKDMTLARISRLKDDMFRRPINLFYSALFGDHPYGMPALGNEDSILNISRQDILNWHARHISTDRLLIVVVGDVEFNQMLDLVESFLANLSREENRQSQVQSVLALHEVQSRIETREKEQTALVLGFPGPDYNDRDYYTLTVLQNIVSGLGGRFFEELRGRQSLAYTVSTFLVSRLYGGCFLSYIATSPDQENVAKDGLLKEFDKLSTEPVTDEELTRSIQYTIGTHKIGLETCRSQMSQLAHDELLGKDLNEIERFCEKIQKVTVDDIMAAAQRFFERSRYAEGIVRGKPS